MGMGNHAGAPSPRSVTSTEDKILSIFTTMKQSVSRLAINWLRENSPSFLGRLLDLQPNGKSAYRFWQRGGGIDRNLRSTRDAHEKILYIHLSPVWLAASAKDWQWSSFRWWQDGIDQSMSLDRDSVPTLKTTDDRIDSKLFD